VPSNFTRDPACSPRGQLTLAALTLGINQDSQIKRTPKPNEMREGGAGLDLVILVQPTPPGQLCARPRQLGRIGAVRGVEDLDLDGSEARNRLAV
jgi:hypothetical protein